MKKGFFLCMMIIFSLLLTACGDNQTNGEVNREKVNVELTVPEVGKPNEAIHISAIVTQGKEMVDDADEVVFEIWKEGQKAESQMVECDAHDKGTYKVDYTFTESGVYFVQVHVTARRMHVMPKTKIVIETGDPS